MATGYTDGTKAKMMTEVRDMVNGSVSPPAKERGQLRAGSLEVGTASMAALLVTYPLTTTAGSAAAGVWTLAFSSLSELAVATGTAAAAQIKDADGNVIVSGLTAGTSATDVIIDDTSVVDTEASVLTSAAVTLTLG